MIAGGTGITPMWQTASQILGDDQDRTTLSLIYANISLDDILIKDLLDHLAAKNPSRSALVSQESPGAASACSATIYSNYKPGHQTCRSVSPVQINPAPPALCEELCGCSLRPSPFLWDAGSACTTRWTKLQRTGEGALAM